MMLDETLPDPGVPGCCIGSAIDGPAGCTCWEKVHDVEQARPVPGASITRVSMCADCAFRQDSPERVGEPTHENSHAGALEELACNPTPFYCHQGMRRVVALVHPSGMRAARPTHEYDPPIVGGVPFKAAGFPADVCAGYLAARARLLRQDAPEATPAPIPRPTCSSGACPLPALDGGVLCATHENRRRKRQRRRARDTCARKVAFETEGAALRALADHRRRGDRTIERYVCLACRRWHLGHPSPRAVSLQASTCAKRGDNRDAGVPEPVGEE